MFKTVQCSTLQKNTGYAKGGGTGGARGAIAPPLFTDHFKNILFDYSDTENCY